jgi:hypothetical protein
LEERNLHKLMKKKLHKHPRLESPWRGELELAGEYDEQWLSWQEEEGGTVYIWRPIFSPEWCYRIESLGAPLLSGLVIPTGTKGGLATTPILGHIDERSLVSAPKLNSD